MGQYHSHPQKPLPILYFYLLSKRRLPQGSRPDFLFIQPWLDILRGQLLRDLTDGWLVLAVVAQEDIKDFRFGALCVHTGAILWGKHTSNTTQLRRMILRITWPIFPSANRRVGAVGKGASKRLATISFRGPITSANGF